MTTYDLSPLYRSTVGFDRLARLMNSTLQSNRSDTGYPPYDIMSIGENRYRIAMALAGFDRENLDVQVNDHTLTISGSCGNPDDDTQYLHRGIAERSFMRRFELADFVKVTSAHFENGMLTIELERDIPDELKPRKIQIETGAVKSLASKAKKLLEGQKDAA